MSEDEDTKCAQEAESTADTATELVPETRQVMGVPFAIGYDPRRSKKGTKPKGAALVRKLARKYTEEAVLTLVDMMRNNRSWKARFEAAKLILERGYGMPRQPLTGPGENEPVKVADGAVHDWLKRLEEHAKNTPPGERPKLLPPPEIQATPEDEED